MIDLLRRYPPAVQWFDMLDEDEEIALPGFVVLELIQGCRNKQEQERIERSVTPSATVWLSPADCNQALALFIQHHLSHHAGVLDVLIGQTSLSLMIPLHTFNQKHYQFIPELQTIQPYKKIS